ncbi:MAG: DUF5343 domain-containing protein [Chloroflexi bacterium]|nr:DUF5343 domain-containing protein [Chloroflexota bacterium]
MIEGLQLLQRASPSKVNEEFLRSHRVAPGNEYKVVGALKFLGLIDEEGKPTEKSQLLKTRGPAYLLSLQDIIRSAYHKLFAQNNLKEANREDIYNYFVTEEGVGAEMALKATRFFLALCQIAGIELAASSRTPSKKAIRTSPHSQSPSRRRRGRLPSTSKSPLSIEGIPLVLAITPEITEMSEEELAKAFRKIHRALRSALEE